MNKKAKLYWEYPKGLESAGWGCRISMRSIRNNEYQVGADTLVVKKASATANKPGI